MLRRRFLPLAGLLAAASPRYALPQQQRALRLKRFESQRVEGVRTLESWGERQPMVTPNHVCRPTPPPYARQTPPRFE